MYQIFYTYRQSRRRPRYGHRTGSGSIVKDARVVQLSDQKRILEAKREVKMEQRNEQKRAENFTINNITAKET